ncbi:MAG TPA: NAD(P)-dependent oxidoreductase [Spirochaetales bacterium]|nr:NAD(P)-dependent oxidoreductase [Spirochaetales bacterium]HRY55138.1 NAD(P)-dependent oxidoreductase [Spirochaetia bacterium]
MRVAITGGTGFIGSHLAELLLAEGHELSCLVLPGEGRRWLEGLPIRFLEGSLLDSRSLGPFLEGADAIVHLAGLTRARSEAEFMAVNADGAVNLVEAARKLGRPPRQVIAMSSLAASGPCGGEGTCLDEDAPLRPLTAYGRSKAALEELVAREAGPIACTFIRAPGVYGPRDPDFLQYFKLVKRGLRLIVGKRSQLSFLYVKTLARAISACLLNPAAYGQAFFVADEGEYDWDQFSALIELALGRRTRRVRVPEWAVRAAALASAAAGPFLRRPPLLTEDKLLEMRQSRWVVSTAKAKRLLGFEPSLSTEDAIAETAAWYREAGWL